MSGEFDPSRHKIVAIVSDPDDPERGQHLHVTVAEFRQVVREIERETAAPAATFPPEVTALLQLILERLDEFDQRLSVIEQVKVQLVQGVVS
jgi:molecular chaperone GrpE (heat shock protein)